MNMNMMIDEEIVRYSNVISKKSDQWLLDMVKYNNSQFNAGIVLNDAMSHTNLVDALVEHHRTDVIRQEEKSERACTNTISFKNKGTRTRFLKLFSSEVQFQKEDGTPDECGNCDYDLIFSGEISDAMKKKIKSYKSITGVVSVL